MVLLDLLGRRWVLRILWELRDEPLNFRELQAACGGISPSVLNTRLSEMRATHLVEARPDEGYALTKWGRELLLQLTPLSAWSEKWAKALD
jgi:DNA-binding HxlR family transcriptional regulator